jgi:hypothetical protein
MAVREPATVATRENERLKIIESDLVVGVSRSTEVKSGRKFFRKGWTHFCDHDKPGADNDEKEREKLASRERTHQCRIRFAKIFDDDSEDGVADKKQPGQNAIRLPLPSSHKPQDREQNDSFEESFVQL